jgi:hypothetical protein
MGWPCGESPGQKLMDASDGMIGYGFEDLAQIEFRIDAVQFGRAEQSVDRSRTFSTGI